MCWIHAPEGPGRPLLLQTETPRPRTLPEHGENRVRTRTQTITERVATETTQIIDHSVCHGAGLSLAASVTLAPVNIHATRSK